MKLTYVFLILLVSFAVLVHSYTSYESEYPGVEFFKDYDQWLLKLDIEPWKLTNSTDGFLLENKALASLIKTSNITKLDANFPGYVLLEKEFYQDVTTYKNIRFNLYLGDVPDDLKIELLLQDTDDVDHNIAISSFEKKKWNELCIEFKENGCSNNKNLSVNVQSIRKLFLKIYSSSEYQGEILIDEPKIDKIDFPDYVLSGSSIKQYDELEISFNLPQYSNPFDVSEIKVDAFFRDPDGVEISVPGFFYRNYERMIKKSEEIVVAEKNSYWKIRFTPTKTGNYAFYIKVGNASREIISESSHFTVVASDKKGFVSSSGNYFTISDEFFYPVGINIASPVDEIYSDLKKKSSVKNEGTFYYEDTFRKMNDNGMNFAEIWLAPWSFELEWTDFKDRNYKGLGQYNLANAWKFDKILEFAEKNNIYLQIVVVNHGQLSTWVNAQWQDNPYNVKNGGFLEKPEQFYTDPRAEDYFNNKLRYLIGRYSYSPRIFSWVLINEIDLTGSEYREINISKAVMGWIDRIDSYVQELDPYNHLLSIHYYKQKNVDDKFLNSQGVNYIITPGYYEVSTGDNIIRTLANISEFTSKYNKPNFISEFGGTAFGSSDENMKRDLVVGLWAGYFGNFSAAPVFWWHNMVNEANLYPVYNSFSKYISDIGSERKYVNSETAVIETGSGNLSYTAFSDRNLTAVFVYDDKVLADLNKSSDFAKFSDAELNLHGKFSLQYDVEFWDMENGKISEIIVSSDNGLLHIVLPVFEKWIAVKIKAKNE